MSGSAREERRRQELAQRRARRRKERLPPSRRLPLVPLSIGAVVLAVVAVIAFAILSAPPAVAEIREPVVLAPAQLADGQQIGVADAPVTVEVWSDFQCPACGNFVRQAEPLLFRDYVEPGNVRVVYRDFPFIGQESTDAAVAARCAVPTNRFWQFHDYLFANQDGENKGAFSQARLEAIASAVGLDLDQFRTCRADASLKQALVDSKAQGSALGVNATPTLTVNGQKVAGTGYPELKAAIDTALSGGS